MTLQKARTSRAFIVAAALLFGALALSTLASCTNNPVIIPGLSDGTADPLADEKAAIYFCNGYVGIMDSMIQYRRLGVLTQSEIDAVQHLRTIAGPPCELAAPPKPTAAMAAALDAVIIVQMQKRARR